ncbi:MAG: bifunctional nuclease family protein [Candidatus Zixiibacteriota bacterium]
MALIEVKIDGLALDMTTNSPVVILNRVDDDKVLPIWIGHSEAWAIAMEMSGVAPKRPMTHDLLKSVIENVSARLNRVEIVELREQTFYAVVIVEINGVEHKIDARPSDSIAIALKMEAPIFVNEDLFDLDFSGEDLKEEGKPDSESLADRLKKINPEDFGKYSL